MRTLIAILFLAGSWQSLCAKEPDNNSSFLDLATPVVPTTPDIINEKDKPLYSAILTGLEVELRKANCLSRLNRTNLDRYWSFRGFRHTLPHVYYRHTASGFRRRFPFNTCITATSDMRLFGGPLRFSASSRPQTYRRH